MKTKATVVSGYDCINTGCRGRPSCISAPCSSARAGVAVVLDHDSFRQLVREEIAELVERAAEPRPALLTTEQLARELGVSVATVRRMKCDGMPVVWVVESPRYQLDEVLVWLRSRRGAQENGTRSRHCVIEVEVAS